MVSQSVYVTTLGD